MQTLVRAFPVLEGKEDDLRKFVSELKSRQSETDAFYNGYGVHRETVHLTRTSLGLIVIVSTDVEDLESSVASYGESQRKFDAWFKKRIRSFSGVDMDKSPAGPPSELLMDWRRARGKAGSSTR